MGRVYAGILGPLAMAVVICRGWLGSGGVEGTLTLAIAVSRRVCSSLALCLGHIAQTTIDESVRAKLEQQLARAQRGSAKLTRIEPRSAQSDTKSVRIRQLEIAFSSNSCVLVHSSSRN